MKSMSPVKRWAIGGVVAVGVGVAGLGAALPAMASSLEGASTDGSSTGGVSFENTSFDGVSIGGVPIEGVPVDGASFDLPVSPITLTPGDGATFLPNGTTGAAVTTGPAPAGTTFELPEGVVDGVAVPIGPVPEGALSGSSTTTLTPVE
ncbi:hypothetical protein [Compostimonas suwonensis]|nr:hypothetical protein [Compostimonas suwonensis]